MSPTRFVSLIALVLAFSSAAQAAKFAKLTAPMSAPIKTFVGVAKGVVAAAAKANFSHVETGVMGFERKADEVDLATAKQWAIGVEGMFGDDKDGVAQITAKDKVSDVAADLLVEIDPSEPELAEKLKATLAPAIKKLVASPGVTVFKAYHADEDGSFAALIFIDAKSKQIGSIVLGYDGT